MPPKISKSAVYRISLVLLATILTGLSLFFIVHAEKEKHSSHSSPLVQTQDDKLKRMLASPSISDFDDWVKKIRSLYYSLDGVDIEKGRALALNRREFFKELMSLSPKAALDHAIPNDIYRRMPASI